MRIAFLNWRDTTHPDGGGAEVYVEAVAQELARRGHEVTIRCAAHAQSADRTRHNGVTIDRRGGRLTVYPWALWWLLVNRRRIDVAVDVINGVPFGSVVVRRTPVVALTHHLHEEQWHIIYPGLGGRLGWFLESRVMPVLYRRVRHLTVSAASRRDLVAIGIPEEAIAIAHNGAGPGPVSRATRCATPRICVLARLVPHKQIEHCLRVIAQLRADHPGLRLDIIGEGWWRPHLEAEVDRLEVVDQVRFHGQVTSDERDDLLRTAWLMVLPSIKEGWGLAIAEAAAQETPTIAYAKAGGVTESIVDGVTGVLVADEQQLTAAVAELLSNPHRCRALGQAARTRLAEYSWARTADVVEVELRRAVE